MTQIFHPATNAFSRVSIFGAVFILAAIGWLLAVVYRSTYVTKVGVPRDQPVQFSHAHHVGGLGIDCRFCHTTAEDQAFAGIPPTETCMNCHSLIWADSPKLAPIRESWRTGAPIAWTRVHDLPDFAYFNHAIHVQKGIGCSTCHGRVDEMPVTWRVSTLHMQWCLDCHRDPQRHVRPRDAAFDMAWRPAADDPGQGARLAEEYGLRKLTDCSTCHR